MADDVEDGRARGLGELPEAMGLSVNDQVTLGEHELRIKMAQRLLSVFLLANAVVFLGLAVFFGFDVTLVREGSVQPSERLVTAEVVMTVVGATTVQLGAIMFTIARYLFPSQ